MILAGDISATVSRLALCDSEGRITVESLVPNRGHQDFASLVRQFLEDHQLSVWAACFGVPGPVRAGYCRLTNLPWELEEDELSRVTGIPSLSLINDQEAAAYGVAALRPDEFEVLNSGVADTEGNRAVIAAGTGLGEAGLIRAGLGWRAIATEGGHTDFGPANELEENLLRFLRKDLKQPSYEQILSMDGIWRIYRFLKESGFGEEPVWLSEEFARRDPAEVVLQEGLKKSAVLCDKALDVFTGIYAAEAGNLALKFLSTGGLYISGSIATIILERLRNPEFLRRFMAKDRMAGLLQSIPVRVVLNRKIGILGAARYAIQRG